MGSGLDRTRSIPDTWVRQFKCYRPNDGLLVEELTERSRVRNPSRLAAVGQNSHLRLDKGIHLPLLESST
jgi:hypothetical protein